MNTLKTELENYKNWALQQSWSASFEPDEIVIIRDAPSEDELKTLTDKFGNLPISYFETLKQIGLSEYNYQIYKTKMLSPSEILEHYEGIQYEMDFYEDTRERVLQETGINFYEYIPVMAGSGIDGCWVLLHIAANSKAPVLYWDADQSFDVSAVYANLREFILESIKSAKEDNPLRLT